MRSSNNQKINDFLLDLQSLSPNQFEIIVLIRELFFADNAHLTEEIKYGGLLFSWQDKSVGGIFAYKEHISIEFSNGAEFTDENGLLEGGGKKRRHLKIRLLEDINASNCAYYIQQAVND